ncbi:hypothetical protein K490DRAFT_75273 [Saccharata proteae CBS 121410]|uniref:VASt domain-containing protein n=1 Tax=Saccharata proteae CBS 121410 TaxID=1314787 RepID=A0A9P4LUS7_9PEZI|nr:hypothetical protein K490DRAFT_75273 [Saccharata proteae CBS 121410]
MDQPADTDSIRSRKRSGLSKVFPTLRHKRGTSSPPVSVRSSETVNDDAGGGLRQSIDDALEKLREKTTRSSTESRRNSIDSLSGSKRLSTLFRKRRKSDAAKEGDEDALGVSNRGLGYDLDVSPSEESLGLAKSVASSLLTEDSDTESPTLSPHQSHAGYLTLSSPLINSDIVETASSSSHPPQPPSRSQYDTLAPKHATGSDLQPAERDRRGSSPGRKLKEAFQPIKKSATSKTSAETGKASSNGGGGGGLGSLFVGGRKSRSSSKVSLVEDAPQNQELAEQPPPPIPPLSLKRQVTPQRIETVPVNPETPPNTTDAPTTLVTPPTPTDSRPNTFSRPSTAAPKSSEPLPSFPKKPDSPSHKPSHSNPNIVVSPTGNLSHRRARSATNPPSKLSNAIYPALTPTVEETKTPGGGLTSPTSGFFSSVFSAAQNAANQFTTSINTSINTGQRSRSGTNPETEAEKIAIVDGGEEVIGGASDAAKDEEPQAKQLAVETLGSGDLSLSRPTTPLIQTDEVSARLEDSAASKAVSAAYLQGTSGLLTNGDRPRTATGISGAVTPPRQQGENGDGNIRRSGSIRSRMSDRRQRRHRGSSATTAPPIAPAINHSATTLTNASVGGTLNASRLTGFAVASSKRNRDFHQQFRSVPEDDYLIEDYSAALQRDILLHGRLYVSEGHICFSSNILGWVTNLVISFDEVMSIEKKSTAVIFPNAIVIQTLHARNVFASLVSRDVTYDLLIGIWKISHPNLKSSLNGVALDAGTGDKTEKADSVDDALEDGSDVGSEDEVYDEDDEDDDGSGSFIEAGEGSVVASDPGDSNIKSVSRKPSAAFGAPANGGSAKDATAAEAVATGASATQDFPGPATHAPTECGDEAQHYGNVLMDTTIPAPLGKVYSLMFGPASGQFMRKWLIEDQKSLDLQMEDDKKGLGEDRKTYGFSYIKPLNASIGPKQTKCIITQTLDQFDLEKAVTVTCSTQNPDVPSGNVFLTKTRYCLMWGPNNTTRMNMNCTIEWSGKSWLKGPIEKGTNDGQAAYAKDLVAGLRAAVSAKPIGSGGKSGGKGGKGKNKRAKKDGSESPDLAASSAAETPAAAQKGSDWGILEPLHGPLSPLTDLLGGFVSAPAIIAGLLLLIVMMWWRQPSAKSLAPHGFGTGSLGVPGLATPQRIVAYEEMWRREESELWDWLEERVGIERAAPVMSVKRQQEKKAEKKLEGEKMSQRQIEEAIRITQERLDVLRGVVERRHGGSDEKNAPEVMSEREL